MNLREELLESGIDPDQTNDLGYICSKCGYEPTNIELHAGKRCVCQQEKQNETL